MKYLLHQKDHVGALERPLLFLGLARRRFGLWVVLRFAFAPLLIRGDVRAQNGNTSANRPRHIQYYRTVEGTVWSAAFAKLQVEAARLTLRVVKLKNVGSCTICLIVSGFFRDLVI
jgi:hypothetical protein